MISPRIELAFRRGGMVLVDLPDEVAAADADRAARRHTEMQPLESMALWELLRLAPTGAVAEVGVYGGETAKLLCTRKDVWLFDTFAGLPAGEGRFRRKQFACSLPAVRAYVGAKPHLVRGVFPDSAARVPDNVRFAFVHLDLDLYVPTLAALRWFWPRMVANGFIVGHDYHDSPRVRHIPGVRRAWNEWARESGVGLVPMPILSSQVVVRKP